MTNLGDIQRELKKIIKSEEFNSYAEKTAMKMVTSLFSDAGRTWRKAARENSKGKMIYEALKNELKGPINGSIGYQIQRNAELIKSIPSTISKDITEHIAKEAFKGRRSAEIAKDLQKEIPYMLESKAKLIARTEVSKTSTALTRARSEEIGITAYIWRTSEDGRVRSSHSHMDGVIVFWNDPPSPEKLIGKRSSLGRYHSGECPNCRCYPESIVSLDLVKWPCKVYYGGKIITMTKKQFKEIM